MPAHAVRDDIANGKLVFVVQPKTAKISQPFSKVEVKLEDGKGRVISNEDGQFVTLNVIPPTGQAAPNVSGNSATLVSGIATFTSDLLGAVAAHQPQSRCFAVPVNDTSIWPAITPDGRFVVFQSTATSLVTNSLADDFHVYVRDLQAGITRLVDADPKGVGSGVTVLTAPQITDDGRYVTFEAPDGSLVPGNADQSWDVFMRDLLAGAVELVAGAETVLQAVGRAQGDVVRSAVEQGHRGLVHLVHEADHLGRGVDEVGLKAVQGLDRERDAVVGRALSRLPQPLDRPVPLALLPGGAHLAALAHRRVHRAREDLDAQRTAVHAAVDELERAARDELAS